MIILTIVPKQGDEESRTFASSNKDYLDYLDYLEGKYSLSTVETASITEGSGKVRNLAFDKIPAETRTMTNFGQFLRVARNKKF